MAISPTFNRVLQLINKGHLLIDRGDGGTWFYLHGARIEMSGRLVIRPDWNEGQDDRPGLMPIIASLRDQDTGFHENGCEPSVERLWDIYEALRERLSPTKIFSRQNGRWVMISVDSQP